MNKHKYLVRIHPDYWPAVNEQWPDLNRFERQQIVRRVHKEISAFLTGTGPNVMISSSLINIHVLQPLMPVKVIRSAGIAFKK